MHSLLRRAIERAADGADIRAVLLTGSGRGFCAGQDLAERDVSPGAAPIDLSVSIGSYYNPLVTERSITSGEHTSQPQSPCNLVCPLLLEKKKRYIHSPFRRPLPRAE